jgi:translation initiation factor 2 alpha subunit (eIF-2alpha)
MNTMKKDMSRFYRDEYPKIDSFVMAEMVRVDELGAECILLEYGSIPAYMGISQFSGKWIKSIRQVAKTGNKEILQVIGVDPTTGAIDLSKKRVASIDVEKGLEQYQKSKKYHTVITRLSTITDIPVQMLYEQFGWNLYDTNQMDDDGILVKIHPIDIMEKSLSNVHVWDAYNIPNDLKDNFVSVVAKRIQLIPQKYEMEINVSCYTENAIDVLQLIFQELEGQNIKCIIKTSPTYVISITSVDEKEGLDTLNHQAQTIKQVAEQHQSTFEIAKEAHNVVTAVE